MGNIWQKMPRQNWKCRHHHMQKPFEILAEFGRKKKRKCREGTKLKE
jgi:hypothetical protein